jgi:propanol-preferring alcohol dehydrogenase
MRALQGLARGSFPVGFFSPAYEVSVASTYWGSLAELGGVIALAEVGKIRAHVQSFAFADAPGAYEAMRAGALQGRAVVIP